jgi:hypothetical protein
LAAGASNIKNVKPVTPPCRKKIYNSAAEAEEMIRHIKEIRFVKNLRAYKCSVCGCWHITSRSE